MMSTKNCGEYLYRTAFLLGTPDCCLYRISSKGAIVSTEWLCQCLAYLTSACTITRTTKREVVVDAVFKTLMDSDLHIALDEVDLIPENIQVRATYYTTILFVSFLPLHLKFLLLLPRNCIWSAYLHINQGYYRYEYAYDFPTFSHAYFHYNPSKSF